MRHISQLDPSSPAAKARLSQARRRDDEMGVTWWNSLSESDRAKWSAAAGNTGRAKDAWEAWKRAQRS